MRDKLLKYTIVASVIVHLAVLGIVGKTSAAKPIAVDQLKVVQVDVMSPSEQQSVAEDKADQSSRTETPKADAESAAPDVPYVPPVKSMVTRDHLPPKVQNHYQPQTWPTQPTSGKVTKMASSRLPGDPGGELSGIGAPNGTDMGRVGSGRTPVGWVPGSPGGQGAGSGSGAGVGRPDPVPDAQPGPGHEPAPTVEAPPPPRMVEITVCAISGMIPGAHCEKKESRSFRDGSEPRSTCDVCKAPEPKFVSRLADRREPELEKDYTPKVPAIDEVGDYVVKVRYTVNTDGSVSDVEIVDSSGISAIDRAVKEAASRMRYKPAVQDGEPRSVKITRKYRINI